ncbi:Uncharacterised protein [Vibrio cholerae]|nr:Uncharacterised protein [Vibrio cholerae]
MAISRWVTVRFFASSLTSSFELRTSSPLPVKDGIFSPMMLMTAAATMATMLAIVRIAIATE